MIGRDHGRERRFSLSRVAVTVSAETRKPGGGSGCAGDCVNYKELGAAK